MNKETVIIGIGGAGCKIISKLNTKINKFAIDTDIITYKNVSTLPIGRNISCGGDWVNGAIAIQNSQDKILDLISKYKKIIIVSSFGGGMSCGGTLKVAELARNERKKVVVISSFPHSHENGKRYEQAIETYNKVNQLVDKIYLVKDIQTDHECTITQYYNMLDDVFIDKIKEILS